MSHLRVNVVLNAMVELSLRTIYTSSNNQLDNIDNHIKTVKFHLCR